MDSIQKLYSDIEKIKKHERASNPQKYDGMKVCQQVKDLFERSNRNSGDLAVSFADYWMDSCIRNSLELGEEPTASSQEKLAALQSLLDGSEDEQDTACLTRKDWKELCSLVTMEAEDLPLDLLNSLMTKFVEKQAL